MPNLGGHGAVIRDAFKIVEVIGPHVDDGHYDLVGPDGEIMLPQVWEIMIGLVGRLPCTYDR